MEEATYVVRTKGNQLEYEKSFLQKMKTQLVQNHSSAARFRNCWSLLSKSLVIRIKKTVQ